MARLTFIFVAVLCVVLLIQGFLLHAFVARPAPKVRPVRIVCFAPSRWPLKPIAYATLDTWARHCDTFLYTSNHDKAEHNVVKVHDFSTDEANTMWPQSQAAWRYIYNHHIDDGDWFIKADTDSYLLVDNMRRFLASLDPSQPHYTGRVNLHASLPYVSGSAIVLNRKALLLLGTQLADCAPRYHGMEDVALGRCLASLSPPITPTISTEDGRERFLVFQPKHMLTARRDNPKFEWYFRNQPADTQEGLRCCTTPVSFHFLRKPIDMYQLEFLTQQAPLQPMWEHEALGTDDAHTQNAT